MGVDEHKKRPDAQTSPDMGTPDHAPDPLARVALLERYKGLVTDLVETVPRETVDLWSILRDDALVLSYFCDALTYDVAALDVGTFVGASAFLLACQPRVRHVTTVDPNPS